MYRVPFGLMGLAWSLTVREKYLQSGLHDCALVRLTAHGLMCDVRG